METEKQDNTPAQGVKLDLTGLVKPLVWDIRTGRLICEATSLIGPYEIYQDGAWIALWFNGARISGAIASVEAAMRAAQADYTDRILSALDLDAIAALVGDVKQTRNEICELADYVLNRKGPGLSDYEAKGIFADLQRARLRIDTALARLGVTE